MIASCFNAGYLPHVATAVRSAADIVEGEVAWYLAGDHSVGDQALDQLVSFARGLGVAAEPLRIPGELVEDFEDSPPLSRETWYRIALPDALPQEQRIIYVDADTLVLQDLSALWGTPLAANDLFAAVPGPNFVNLSRLGLTGKRPYFNAGVLVMDADRMRREGVLRQVKEFVESDDRPALAFADQDVLNSLFADRWHRLDPRWNCVSAVSVPDAFKNPRWPDDPYYDPHVLERARLSPAIVHFDGMPQIRPWHRRSPHPMAGLYRAYRAMTPWPLRSMDGGSTDAALAKLPLPVQSRIWSLTRRMRSLGRRG